MKRIAKRFVESINQFNDWGIHIVGYLDSDSTKIDQMYYQAPILGDYNSLTEILHSHFIEEVIFTIYSKDLREGRDLFAICETEGVQVRIISSLFKGILAKAEPEMFHGIPIITYYMAPRQYWQLFLKRVFDLFISSLLLMLLTPVFFIIAVLVRISSAGPVLYHSNVLGRNKKPIVIYKFRTMYQNSDSVKEELWDKNELNGPVFKMKDDPRVTKIGRFLRKFSLDELPQLFNVLKGDLSLVGPRPPLQSELPKFKTWHTRKLSVKPGMTGLWQVSRRNEIKNFDEWVRLDLRYIDNWSLGLDIKILFLTIPTVLKGTGL